MLRQGAAVRAWRSWLAFCEARRAKQQQVTPGHSGDSVVPEAVRIISTRLGVELDA